MKHNWRFDCGHRIRWRWIDLDVSLASSEAIYCSFLWRHRLIWSLLFIDLMPSGLNIPLYFDRYKSFYKSYRKLRLNDAGAFTTDDWNRSTCFGIYYPCLAVDKFVCLAFPVWWCGCKAFWIRWSVWTDFTSPTKCDKWWFLEGFPQVRKVGLSSDANHRRKLSFLYFFLRLIH